MVEPQSVRGRKGKHERMIIRLLSVLAALIAIVLLTQGHSMLGLAAVAASAALLFSIEGGNDKWRK